MGTIDGQVGGAGGQVGGAAGQMGTYRWWPGREVGKFFFRKPDRHTHTHLPSTFISIDIYFHL